MIQQIIAILDAAAGAAIPIHERVGLAEHREVSGSMRPTYYIGGTDARHIVEDNKGSVSYWRMTAPYRQTVADKNRLIVCGDALKRTYSLRYVIFWDRSDAVCSELPDVLGAVGSALTGTAGAIESALRLLSAVIMPASTETDVIRAAAAEMPGAVMPMHKGMAYIDVSVEIQGEPGCFDECGDPVTVTVGSFCDIVRDHTWGEIGLCLTAEQEDDAVDDLCNGGVCLGVDILDGDGNVIAHIDDGGTYTITEMPYIVMTYADEAAALADNATVPAADQAIKITDSGRLYQGDGVSSSAVLIAAKKFTPGFTEDPATGLKTTFEGADVNVQIF